MLSETIYDPSTHSYFLDGKPIPSVTEILREAGMYQNVKKSDTWDEYYLKRGEYVHLACRFVLEEKLDEDQLHEDLKPYVAAFREFVRDTGFLAHIIEQPMRHTEYRFGGTPDLAGQFKSKDSPYCVIDIKSGSPNRAHQIQTAAYAILLRHNYKWHGMNRYALYLGPGKYKLVAHTGADEKVFMAALTLYHWLHDGRPELVKP